MAGIPTEGIVSTPHLLKTNQFKTTEPASKKRKIDAAPVAQVPAGVPVPYGAPPMGYPYVISPHLLGALCSTANTLYRPYMGAPGMPPYYPPGYGMPPGPMMGMPPMSAPGMPPGMPPMSAPGMPPMGMPPMGMPPGPMMGMPPAGKYCLLLLSIVRVIKFRYRTLVTEYSALTHRSICRSSTAVISNRRCSATR